MIFHLVLLVIALISAGTSKAGLSGAKIVTYDMNITWVPRSEGVSETAYDFIPNLVVYDSTPRISVTWVTVSFFALSAFFHSWPALGIPLFAEPYYRWIDECRNPLRWIEYSFSASVMALILAASAGVRSMLLLVAIFVLIWTTMVFGWVNEALSRPDTRGVRAGDPYKHWMIRYHTPVEAQGANLAQYGSLAGESVALLKDRDSRHGNPNHTDTNQNLSFPALGSFGATLQRLGPFFLGFVPYATAWWIILHVFARNIAPYIDVIPWFVPIIVYGEAISFTFFAVVQFIQQVTDSCVNYWLGELIYLILSMQSKGMLGGILIFNVIFLSNFDQIVN